MKDPNTGRVIDEQVVKDLNKKIDTLPYRIFNKVRHNYSEAKLVLRDRDFTVAGIHLSFKSHRDYIAYRFKEIGIEVTRWNHDYESLNTPHPKLGLVYLANDSVLDPGLEVIALVDHNCKRLL
jgi:hypothetical protein